MAVQANELSQEKLKEVLHYNPDTGILTRLASGATGARYVGKPTGSVHKASGYVFVWVMGRMCKAHRIAWLYMTGDWPSLDIDHKDCDKTNNRWSNLRLATRSQNNVNTVKRGYGASGVRGVLFDKRYREPWKAYMSVMNKTVIIGRFRTKEDAVAARSAATIKRDGEFARI